MLKKINNVVLDLNVLEQGLNFLVTGEWWNDFLRVNEDASLCSDIVIPASHPLIALIEMGIIKYNHNTIQTQLISLQDNAKKEAKNITNQVNYMLATEENKNNAKNYNQILNQWAFLNLDEPNKIKKIIICPEVDLDLIKDLFQGSFQWKIIKPSLYRLICQNHSQINGNKFTNQILGIPIFLESEDVSEFKGEMSYNLSRQIYGNIYFYNTVGVKYSIIGAIQSRLSLPKMINYLYLGIKKIAVEEEYEVIANQQNKNTISIYQNQIYSNFIHQRSNNNKLKWNSSNKIPSNVYTDQFQFIQFSSDSQNRKSARQDQQLFKNSSPSKKIKQNEVGIGVNKSQKSKGFQPTGNSLPISRICFDQASIGPTIKETNFVIQPRRSNQYHSSTEEQTPSAVLRQNSLRSLLHMSFMKYHQKRNQNRIKFPIWASNMNVKSLLKFAELKTNDFITLPFTDSKRLATKTKNHKRVFLSGRCNRICQNELGQQIQKESPQQQPQIFAIPNETIKLLQSLAVEVATNKNKINVEKILIKQDILEPAKQKGDISSQTCKNQDLDELESFQSQQF